MCTGHARIISRSEPPNRRGQVSSGLLVSLWLPLFGLFAQQDLSRSRCSVPAAAVPMHNEPWPVCRVVRDDRPAALDSCRCERHGTTVLSVSAAGCSLGPLPGHTDLSSIATVFGVCPSLYRQRTGLHRGSAHAVAVLLLRRTRRPHDRPDTCHPHPPSLQGPGRQSQSGLNGADAMAIVPNPAKPRP